MNEDTQITIAAAGGAVLGTLAFYSAAKLVKAQRDRIRKINLRKEREIEAIRTAKTVMLEQLEKPEYRRTLTVAKLMSDLEFHTIVAFNNEKQI